MIHDAVRDVPAAHSGLSEVIDRAIFDQIEEQAVIGLDALVTLLPEYSWSQIFHAVDRLARNGKITLRRHRCDYTIFSILYVA